MSTINLLPDDYVQRIMRKRMNLVCTVLFAVTLGAVVTAAMVSQEASRHTRQVRETVETAYAQAAEQLKQLQNLEARKQTMVDRAESISSLLERVPRSHLLAVITNCLPENTSLTKVELDTKRIVSAPRPTDAKATKFDTMTGQAAAKPMPAVVALDVTGLAGTDVEVARFIANLARNPLVGAVDLAYSQEKEVTLMTLVPQASGKPITKEAGKVKAREFQVHVELRTDADAIQDTGEATAVASGGAE